MPTIKNPQRQKKIREWEWRRSVREKDQRISLPPPSTSQVGFLYLFRNFAYEGRDTGPQVSTSRLLTTPYLLLSYPIGKWLANGDRLSTLYLVESEQQTSRLRHRQAVMSHFPPSKRASNDLDLPIRAAQLGVPMMYGFSSAYIMPWTGVGTFSFLPNSTTLPPSQGSSSRLPRSRSRAMDAFMAGGT